MFINHADHKALSEADARQVNRLNESKDGYWRIF